MASQNENDQHFLDSIIAACVDRVTERIQHDLPQLFVDPQTPCVRPKVKPQLNHAATQTLPCVLIPHELRSDLLNAETDLTQCLHNLRSFVSITQELCNQNVQGPDNDSDTRYAETGMHNVPSVGKGLNYGGNGATNSEHSSYGAPPWVISESSSVSALEYLLPDENVSRSTTESTMRGYSDTASYNNQYSNRSLHGQNDGNGLVREPRQLQYTAPQRQPDDAICSRNQHPTDEQPYFQTSDHGCGMDHTRQEAHFRRFLAINAYSDDTQPYFDEQPGHAQFPTRSQIQSRAPYQMLGGGDRGMIYRSPQEDHQPLNRMTGNEVLSFRDRSTYPVIEPSLNASQSNIKGSSTLTAIIDGRRSAPPPTNVQVPQDKLESTFTAAPEVPFTRSRTGSFKEGRSAPRGSDRRHSLISRHPTLNYASLGERVAEATVKKFLEQFDKAPCQTRSAVPMRTSKSHDQIDNRDSRPYGVEV